MKTALVIGATGLVGNNLVHLLLEDNRFNKVIVFARRSLKIQNTKLEEHIINFDSPTTWQHLVKGDVMFSALGTTIKQAGSQQAQYKIDYTYQYQFAEAASNNKVPVYVLVSSSGANPESKIFYSRIKGELERDVKKLSFSSIYFLQPSLLVGHREEERIGEKIGYKVLKAFNSAGIFKKYRPIEGKIVAKAMIHASMAATKGIHVVALREVFTLAGED
jgi:uncharacterized protein YbjT (DUF2867 family)